MSFGRIARFFRRVVGAQDLRVEARHAAERAVALDAKLAKLKDEALKARADQLHFKAKRGEPLDELLSETLAVAREVARRTLGLKAYPVQLLGAAGLHLGQIVEMKTGEGKTLTAALTAALHGFTGKGVQVVTVNDYLARRDGAALLPFYRFMGLSVGVVAEDLDPERDLDARKSAYAADVTYLTNSELVFDYLRDHLATHRSQQVQRPFFSALVDEVDLLLLDEARTPLIISEATGDEVETVKRATEAMRGLSELDYRVERRDRQASFTERGLSLIEAALGQGDLSAAHNLRWMHAARNALQARAVFELDVDYVVERGRIFLVDEFTGRISPDKRLADGLHQALEAKEGVPIRTEDQVLARTSYQSFFRLYPRIAGMTGTASSARMEFTQAYGLSVMAVPTHRPLVREDLPSVVYRSAREQHRAVVEEVSRLRASGRPVLVGTTSVKASESLSLLLKEEGIPHQVLNARHHEREAEIIAQAGRAGAVTLSTNMAGRGVDILLGGTPGTEAERQAVVAAGGLAVLGVGLAEAKRLDDQLRGRAGRQGDPGSSRFFLCLDDPIYRQFGELIEGIAALDGLRQRLANHPEGEPVRDPQVLSTLEALRRKVEVENEATRVEVLRYDQILARQRTLIYRWRQELLDDDPSAAREALIELIEGAGEDLLGKHFGEQGNAEAAAGFLSEVTHRFGIPASALCVGPLERCRPERLVEGLVNQLTARLKAREATWPQAAVSQVAMSALLSNVDRLWTEHLTAIERLEESVGLCGYAGQEPLVEFRRASGQMFKALLASVRLDSLEALLMTIEGEPVPKRSLQRSCRVPPVFRPRFLRRRT